MLMQSSLASGVVITGDESRLSPGMHVVPPTLAGGTGHGEERCSPGVTVRIVDRIALPSILMELVLLCVLCAAALGARREGGLSSFPAFARKFLLALEWRSLPTECSILVVLDSKTSLSAPGVRSSGFDAGSADLEVVISFIRAEKTRFGSTGVDDSSIKLSIGMGSRKAASVPSGSGFLFVERDAAWSASLPILSFDSWMMVRRLIACCASVSCVDVVPQLVTRDADVIVACTSL